MFIFLIVPALLIVYALKSRKSLPKLNGRYAQTDGNLWSRLKQLDFAIILGIVKTIKRIYRRKHPEVEKSQNQLKLGQNEANSVSFFGCDKNGNIASIRLTRYQGNVAQVNFVIRHVQTGSTLVLDDKTVLSRDETPFGEEANDNDEYIAANGLRIKAVDPVNTFRIMFCGLMKLQLPGLADKFVQVNLRLWFKSLSDPADFSIDYSPFLTATCLAREESNWSKLLDFMTTSNQRRFEQTGELRGTIEISGDTFSRNHEIAMNGTRNFVAGGSSLRNVAGFFNFHARFNKGLIFSLYADSQQDGGISHHERGFVTYQTGFVYPVTWTDFHLSRLVGQDVPSNMSLNLQSHGNIFELKVQVLSRQKSLIFDPHNACKPLVVEHCFVKAVRGDTGEIGFGTIEYNFQGQRGVFADNRSDLQILLLQLPKPHQPTPAPQCVQLNNPLCRISALTGGKAGKLADLISCSGSETGARVNLGDFVKVPDGFAITVAAFENHLKTQPALAEMIKEVVAAASKGSQSTNYLDDKCKQLHEAFQAAPLAKELLVDIENALKATFGENDFDKVITAVRSSAVGEDGTEASGAGQMETFLGRRGIQEIVEATKLSWASHYSFRALQYRRQLCAKLDSPMAVLVQRLVDADVAGVLFTRHPDTGSTAEMVINACYGIGEGVVSGHVQPDTVTVSRVSDNRTAKSKIRCDDIGEKSTAFKLDKKTARVKEGDTIERGSQFKCCLSDAEIIQLEQVGDMVERVFGSGRDVEFAVTHGSTSGQSTVYLLQARPITTADLENEWELTHEFDFPLASDVEWITTANVQEMMPGAMSPLSAHCWIRTVSNSVAVLQQKIHLKPYPRHTNSRCSGVFYQHVFINWTVQGAAMIKEYTKKAGDMALFGRHVPDLTCEMFEEQNDMSSKYWQSYVSAEEWRSRLLGRNPVKQCEKYVDSYTLPDISDPKELFKFITTDLLPDVQKAWAVHLQITGEAAMLPMVIMHTMDSTLKWGPQIYEDMATLLSSCTNVFSADVPTLLQEIAASVRADEETAKKFQEVDRQAATQWLLGNESGPAGQMFRSFLNKHGHRCVRDSDIREKSWNQEPEKVVDALKVMITGKEPPKSVVNQKRQLSVDEAMDAIKTPLNGRIQKAVIKYFLPKARVAVGQRELTKSMSIKIHDQLRRAYYRLAELLTETGVLPDADLIFFLVPDEIESLLERRSPKLIAKALRRRKFLPRLSNLQFHELKSGHPEPIESNEADVSICASGEGEFTVKGMAVGNGCIEGVARVVKSLDEANCIENGDILVVPYTDVGWTPYFPLISGLVTELGGLISHGAVVAREYGLPCLVGCKKAAELVKTGDRIKIDGRLGEIRVTRTSH